jgi:hypothetical protein
MIVIIIDENSQYLLNQFVRFIVVFLKTSERFLTRLLSEPNSITFCSSSVFFFRVDKVFYIDFYRVLYFVTNFDSCSDCELFIYFSISLSFCNC